MSTSLVSVPCVVGWVKPVILLPVSMLTSLDTSEIEMILVHELAHVRRYDVLVNIIQTAMETVFFFSPAIWWLSRQIRIEREHCCDDTVVASTGDKLKYARALANLEESRMFQTSFSAAITGSPLANRIKRLVGESIPRLCSSGLSFPGMIVMVSLITVSLITFGGSQNSVVKADTKIETAAEFSPERGDIGGDWEIEAGRGRKSDRIHIYRGRSTHTEMKFEASELLQKIGGNPAKFQFVRDAGSFIFEGEIDQTGRRLRGQGEWYFQADAEYVGFMRKFGLRANDDEKIFTLALFDVTKEYVSELEDLGFRRLDVGDFVTGRVHGVTPERIREFQDAGFGDISFDEHVAVRIFKVSPWTSRELSDLGFDELSADDLISAKIHDVTPKRIEAYQDAGFQNLSFDDLIAMVTHEVTPRYIREMAKLGYDDVSPRMLIELRKWHVTPSFVRRLQRKGLDNLTPKELINYRVGRR